MENNHQATIWFKNGESYLLRDVSNVQEVTVDDTRYLIITFSNYETGQREEATFNLQVIAGYSRYSR